MKINNIDYRSVWWEHNHLKMIDQNKLPFEFGVAEYSNYLEVATAIREMTVRGAPALQWVRILAPWGTSLFPTKPIWRHSSALLLANSSAESTATWRACLRSGMNFRVCS